MSMIHGKNVFPLELVLHGAAGYFMDAQGEIWSEKSRKGVLIRLAGSTSANGRYVNLSIGGFSTSHKVADLTIRAQRHTEFAKHTAPFGEAAAVVVPKTTLAAAQAAALTASAPFQSKHAASIDAGIKLRGWVIATVENGKLSFGADPKIHITDDSVNTELARLASAKRDTKYVKLQIQAALTLPALPAAVWE